jgi:hypothetical protein
MEIFESSAANIDDLLREVSNLRPDTVLVEETSPLSVASSLVHLMKAMPGHPVVVLSQEQNLMHVVQWQTVHVEKANDLVELIDFAQIS